MANLPALTPTNFIEAMQFAEALAKSTMVPPAFQRNPANILVAIQWGAELGLGPLQALQNIAVVNGRPSIYGDAMLALVRGSPLCEDIIEVIKGEGDLATAVCDARRKGAEPVVRAFSVHDAKRAGLWDKAGPWKQYPLRMLQMRARGFALRDAFPDVLRGVISAEEAADIPHEPKDITPSSPLPVLDDLNAFAAGAEPDVEPDQAETDKLLLAAWVHAKEGYDTFRAWYLGLDDDQRLSLRPHIKLLQEEAARKVPPAPDDPAQTPAALQMAALPGGAAGVDPLRTGIDDGPPLPRPRGRPRSRPPSPASHDFTDEEIDRSQDAIAAVAGFDDPPSDINVLVPFDAASNVQEWFGRARERLREMQQARLTPDRFTAYQKANAGALMRLRAEFFSYWEQLNQIIAAGERGGPALGYVRSEE